MFLNSIKKRNQKMIEVAIKLHQEGKIPSNSYILDIDTIKKNAETLATEGEKYNFKVFAMTKQIGRNPVALKAIKEAGIKSCVTVDMNDARPVHASGLQVGHLGHLVQVPHHETKAGLRFKPTYWTVFSKEKAKAISDAIEGDYIQNIMVRVYDEKNDFYKGHEGGFKADDILEVKKMIDDMPGLRFAGITTFPAQLFDKEKMDVVPTNNCSTLMKAAQILKDDGINDFEINAPGTTSSLIFERLAKLGVTQVEPGNSLAGTVPLGAFKETAEIPAMLYLSEVSHEYMGKSYCYGGGMYVDPVFDNYDVQAFVGDTAEKAFNQKISCDIPDPSAIDYYGILNPKDGQIIKQGDSVIFGFRAQTFVTRAYMVPISGIQTGEPKVEGIFNTEGRAVGWPSW